MDKKYEVVALLLVLAIALYWKLDPVSRYLSRRPRRQGGNDGHGQYGQTSPAEAASIAVDESLSTPISS